MSDQPSQTAIVTGAARGIGAAVAERLLADGMSVALLDNDAEALSVTAKRLSEHGHVHSAVTDVRDPESVDAAVASTREELGDPTVLVNDAGYIRDNLFHKMTLQDWDDVMNVHLRAAFITTHAVTPFMSEAGAGRIINISSIAALGNRGQANYSAAKAGIQGFTRTLAIELGRFGITANAIAPGFIDTDMTRATAARMRMDFDDLAKTASKQIPLGRIGRPDDIASVASFLAGPDSRYVTGQIIYVTGGPTV
ncbi:3-oxoacyl-ACP reductase FabG [Gordonia sp. NB41Y]|uniref:3-oxoacyl-ACP reductase FabG n=1 Tax=Gordonia sp. NB41Y TaxID=875808 RepID=UPI0002BECC2F|nr:3-oxoacyl-ACP reductase FabG [Gordonia sp. NB41Y]EMP15151.1 3-oxoacyl-ACP reductase [Gordonia sp. NB41Y]WLP92930.1 3-oxoacyl-ACP reductase FabG [Gordonia sp. NB41Y]